LFLVSNNDKTDKIFVFVFFSFDRQIEQKKRKKEDLKEKKWMDDLIQQPYNIHI